MIASSSVVRGQSFSRSQKWTSANNPEANVVCQTSHVRKVPDPDISAKLFDRFIGQRQ
jgi:hypothetical protein